MATTSVARWKYQSQGSQTCYYVSGICYTYVCRRRCVYHAPRYEEYAFRYLWPRACGQRAVQRYGIKACCVTYGRY